MLHCKYRSGHKYSHLLAVGYSFERCTNGNFGFTKSNIATYKPVHRHIGFHILFDIGGSFHLIGCIFIQKRSLQLLLQITVGRKFKSFFGFSLGIELNQVAGYVLDFGFCAFFQPFPGTGAELVDTGCLAFFAFVF